MTNTLNGVQTLKAHLAINVKDVTNSIEFYKKLFGIEPSKVRTGYAKFDVQNPPLNFTLNQVPFNETGALSHLGIQVATTEDVLSVKEKWIEQGLLTKDEMQTSCCYAVQDKTWVRDPDGNEWEVFAVLEDNLPESDPCACGVKMEEGETQIKLSGQISSCSTDVNSVTETSSCCGTNITEKVHISACEVAK